MQEIFSGGVWPVMLTPFTDANEVDYEALKALTNWYIEKGVNGLFAVCQSSEMFFLSLEERIKVATCVKEAADGRVPVIASGHIADDFGRQVDEITKMAATGVDAVILITNRLAKESESDEYWIANMQRLLTKIPEDIKLGFYECPYPYKRVMTKDMTKACADTGRFYFLKDTSCDINNIADKLEVIKDTNFKLYNANTATLLESIKLGAAGYSGVMANFHPQLYVRLLENTEANEASLLSDALTIMALIERQCYPVNAKYYLQSEGLPISLYTRTRSSNELNETLKKEVMMLDRLTKHFEKI